MNTSMKIAAAVLSALAAATPVLAQQSKAQPAKKTEAQAAKAPAAKAKKPEAGKTFGDWAIACEIQADKTEKCFASQYQFVTESGQRVINIHFGYFGPKGEATVVAFLPLGLDIAAGATLAFEPGPQVPLAITTCVPEGCRASATLDSTAQKAVREAKAISVVMLPFGQDRMTTMAISVKGLAAAFASLK